MSRAKKREKNLSPTKKGNVRTEGDKWAEMVESIGRTPLLTTGSLWVSVGDIESDVFDDIKPSQALGWHGLVRICLHRVMTTASGTKSNLKTYARTLESMTYKTMVLRGRNGEPQRTVKLEVAWADHSPTIKQSLFKRRNHLRMVHSLLGSGS